MSRDSVGSTQSKLEKPDYVADLEAAYGPPSQEGFGSAVFFEQMEDEDALEELAKEYYRYFVGELWERWSQETWMGPWKEVYARKTAAKHDVVKELNGIEDRDAANSVPIILEIIENAEAAQEALANAYDDADVADLRVYNIGDGEAMSGLVISGQRENGEATFLVFLYD
jgi:hypothetical protein